MCSSHQPKNMISFVGLFMLRSQKIAQVMWVHFVAATPMKWPGLETPLSVNSETKASVTDWSSLSETYRSSGTARMFCGVGKGCFFSNVKLVPIVPLSEAKTLPADAPTRAMTVSFRYDAKSESRTLFVLNQNRGGAIVRGAKAPYCSDPNDVGHDG